MAITSYDSYVICFSREHEKVQEGWQRTAWIETPDGKPTASIFKSASYDKDEATRRVKELAELAITSKSVKLIEPKQEGSKEVAASKEEETD